MSWSNKAPSKTNEKELARIIFSHYLLPVYCTFFFSVYFESSQNLENKIKLFMCKVRNFVAEYFCFGSNMMLFSYTLIIIIEILKFARCLYLRRFMTLSTSLVELCFENRWNTYIILSELITMKLMLCLIVG